MTHANGYDLKAALAWYTKHQQEILRRFPGQSQDVLFKPLSGHHMEFNMDAIKAVLNRFPVAARNRTHLKLLSVTRPHWYTTRSLPGNPVAYFYIEEAISPTAMATSFSNPSVGEIVLYELGIDDLTPEIQRIVHVQALTHALANMIIWNDLWHGESQVTNRARNQHVLAMKGEGGREKQAEVFKWLGEFRACANHAGPISQFAANFYGDDGLVLKTSPSFQPIFAVLSECVAAYLLGMAFRADGTGLDPFGKNKELRQMVRDFLLAERR